jgi:hypothetical protein
VMTISLNSTYSAAAVIHLHCLPVPCLRFFVRSLPWGIHDHYFYHYHSLLSLPVRVV